MIVVKVELHAGGRGGPVTLLNELRIANVSELADVSNYEYALFAPETSMDVQQQGHVKGHKRSDGVMKLLRRVMDKLYL